MMPARKSCYRSSFVRVWPFKARLDSVLPVSIVSMMVPVGTPISTAAGLFHVAHDYFCTVPFGPTWAGCMVAKEGAQPAATPTQAHRIASSRLALLTGRDMLREVLPTG